MSHSFPLTPLVALKAPGQYSMVGGPFGSKLVSADYVTKGVPVIRGVNLPDDQLFTFDNLVFVTQTKARRDLFGNIARPGDLVVTQRGTLGQVGLIPMRSPYPEFVVSQSQMKLTVDPLKVDVRFVYYALKSPMGQHEISSKAISAGVPHINLGLFQQVCIPLPPRDLQAKIAKILSTYDDLIESNTRRIEVLEEMARRIYHEWFVEFRYPGHEHVQLVESEAGRFPDGWEIRPASEALEINPRVPLDPTEGCPFVAMGSLSEHTMNIGPLERRPAPTGPRFQNNDTLFARITPCLENGKTGFVKCLREGQVGCGSTEFIVLRSRVVNPEFVYLLARDERFRSHAIASMSGATGRQRVRDECFDTFLLPVPPRNVLVRFGDVMRPIFHLSAALFQANLVARQARDLLLPRLISGDIEITDLKIATPPTAA